MTDHATLGNMRSLHRPGVTGQSIQRFRVDLDGSIYSDRGAAIGQVKDGAFRRSATYEGPKWPVDLMSRMQEAARKYDLSSDPRNFIFDTGRANTATVPNDNHLSFGKEELFKRRASTGRKTYQSYIGSPHHMEHQTDNPHDARGFVLDAEYWDKSPAASVCSACGRNPRRRANRRPNGIQCLCGRPVKDEYVAALIAIDSLKDPGYANAVERGDLPYWSMGCGIGRIACSLDGKASATDAGTCQHIRGSNLGRLWLIDSEGARQVSKDEARALARAANRKFVPEDFMELVLDTRGEAEYAARTATSLKGPRRIVRSYECAQDFEYDDISNVQVGGDRRSVRSETISARRQAAAGRSTKMSQKPDNSAPATGTDGSPKASPRREAMRFTVVRINGDANQTYAAESPSAALNLARPDPGSTGVMAEVEAPDAESAVLAMDEAAEIVPIPDSMLGGEMERDSDVTVEIPEGETLIARNTPTEESDRAQPGEPPMPAGPDMSQIDSPLDELPSMAPEDLGMSGVPPQGDPQQQPLAQPAMPRQMALKDAYQDWNVITSRTAGLAILRTPDNISVAHFRTRQASATLAGKELTADAIKKSLCEVGLGATLERYAGTRVTDLSRLAMQGIADESPISDVPDAAQVNPGPVHKGQTNDIKEQETSEVAPAQAVGEPQMDIKVPDLRAEASKDEDSKKDEDGHAGVEDDGTGGGSESLGAAVTPAAGMAASANLSEAEARDQNAKEAVKEGASDGDSETPINEPIDVEAEIEKRVAAQVAEQVAKQVAALDERYRRAARLAAEQTEVEIRRREAAVREATKEGLRRGMDVEFQRVAANVARECRFYDDVTRVLSSASEVGVDMASGKPIVYEGLHNKMARRLASQLVQEPVLELVNYMIDRGMTSLDYDEQVMIQREADLKGLSLPEVVIESQEEASVARTARAQRALEADELRGRMERSARSGGMNRADQSYVPPRRSRPEPAADPLDDALSSLGLSEDY